MHIEKLEYLVEVAKTGSITQAAHNLNVTISALSQSITSLEKEWGVSILKRSRSGAIPTAEGKVIIKKAYELLDKYEELKEVAMGYSNTIKGQLRLATIPGPMFLLEKAVMDFKHKYPQVKLEIVEQGSQDIIDNILNDKSDLGFIILFKDRLIEHTGLTFERLLKVKMVAATSMNSPLAFNKFITPEELRQQTLVLYNDDYVKWFMDDFQKKYGSVDVIYTTNNRELITRACLHYSAVTVGLNYSFITEPLFNPHESVILDFDMPEPSPVYLGIIQRKDTHPNNISKHFLERLKHDISELDK